MPRRAFASLVILCALAGPLAHADDGWKEAGKSDGIAIFNRQRPGSDIAEVKAIGVIDAPPWIVKNVIDDVGRYKEFMPYTKASDILKKEPAAVVSYQRIDAPLVDNRDYTIRIRDESRRLADGRVVYKNHWVPAEGIGPKPIEGVVRVNINEGYWLLEDEDGGKRTRATYYVYTDPGGSLPSFIVNAANTNAIPDLFKAVSKASKDARYRKERPKLPLADDTRPAPAVTSPK